MKRASEHTRTSRQSSTPYRATDELEAILAASRDVVLEGGDYVAHVSMIAGAGFRFYEAYTDSQPFVYGPSRPTLQAALDALDERYRAVPRT